MKELNNVIISNAELKSKSGHPKKKVAASKASQAKNLKHRSSLIHLAARFKECILHLVAVINRING